MNRFFAGLSIFFFDYVLIEIILPLNPLLIEWLLKNQIPQLGEFKFYDKPLAISCIMVPLISFARNKDNGLIVKFLYACSTLFGTILFVVLLFLQSRPDWQPEIVKMYRLASLGLAATIFLGSIDAFAKYCLRPLHVPRKSDANYLNNG